MQAQSLRAGQSRRYKIRLHEAFPTRKGNASVIPIKHSVFQNFLDDLIFINIPAADAERTRRAVFCVRKSFPIPAPSASDTKLLKKLKL
jgi:hypothetical protein